MYSTEELYRTAKKTNVFFAVILSALLITATVVDLLRASVINWVSALLPWAIILALALLLVLVLRVWLCEFATEPRWRRQRVRWLALSCAASAFLLAAAVASVYTTVFFFFNEPSALLTARGVLEKLFSPSNFFRAVVLYPVALLAVSMLLQRVERVLSTAFRRRWILALGVFVLFVACGINFSNVGAYDNIVQMGQGDDLCAPLFGIARGIRSDEWLVNLPFTVSTKYAGYGEWNELLRGTVNYNLPATGLYLCYAALNDPLSLGYFFLGTELGVSFYWCAAMLLSVMLSMEIAYIVSKRNRTAALLGVALLALSPFNLWWSICALLTGFLGVLVCTYYCFSARRFSARVLCMLGVAASGAYFICQLYPAWQVPMCYVLLSLMAWIVVDRFEGVKRFRVRDWLCAAAAFLLMASIVLSYLSGIQPYTEAIMTTVYPGERFETGGYSLGKNFAFLQGLQMPFRDIVTDGTNNSEAGTFFSLYPLPTLFAISVLIRQLAARRRDKTERVDLFNLFLLIPTVFLTVYCTVGFPRWLAKYTLMSYTMGVRAVDMLALIDVLLLLRHATRSDRYKLPVWLSGALTAAVIANSIVQSSRACPGYLTVLYTVLASGLALALGIACFTHLNSDVRRRMLRTVALLLLAVGLAVTPINSGIRALTEKPVAKEIQAIAAADPKAKWIGYRSIIAGQYAVANGARCITSTNYIPNLELWSRLDPDGAYNEIYNRYAHVTMEFAEETSFSLIGADHMRVCIAYAEIIKTEARYVLSETAIEEDSDCIDLTLLYESGGYWIYEITYLK